MKFWKKLKYWQKGGVIGIIISERIVRLLYKKSFFSGNNCKFFFGGSICGLPTLTLNAQGRRQLSALICSGGA